MASVGKWAEMDNSGDLFFKIQDGLISFKSNYPTYLAALTDFTVCKAEVNHEKELKALIKVKNHDHCHKIAF